MGDSLSRREDDSTEETEMKDEEVPFMLLPETMVISRKAFDTHMRGHSFKTWEELVRALPEGAAPQGASSTSVKCDPMQVFAWVATLLIQVCIWGLVGFFAMQNVFAGLAVTALYGALLFLVIERVPRQMAGMLWPNLPVIVGAVGLQAAMMTGGDAWDAMFDNGGRVLAVKLLFCTIIPATATAVLFMRRLPEDPDRAVLFTNLFVGIWAGVVTISSICVGEANAFLWYFSQFALAVLGVGAMGMAAYLRLRPGQWGSVELVSWSLNVGAIAFLLGSGGLFFFSEVSVKTFGSPAEVLCWVGFAAVVAMLGALGLKLQRTFPVLLSACGLAAICIRFSVAVGMALGSVAGLCTFGALGIAVVFGAQQLLKSSEGAEIEGRALYS
jgi:hypothetical protein